MKIISEARRAKRYTDKDISTYLLGSPLKKDLDQSPYTIDSAKTVKGAALFHLLHLRLGCIGVDVLKTMTHQHSVQGLPLKAEIPEDFDCPICLGSKSQTVGYRPRANLVFNIKGARFHMDFNFFNVPSIHPFLSLLKLSFLTPGSFFAATRTLLSLFRSGFVNILSRPMASLLLLLGAPTMALATSGAAQNVMVPLLLNTASWKALVATILPAMAKPRHV